MMGRNRILLTKYVNAGYAYVKWFLWLSDSYIPWASLTRCPKSSLLKEEVMTSLENTPNLWRHTAGIPGVPSLSTQRPPLMPRKMGQSAFTVATRIWQVIDQFRKSQNAPVPHPTMLHPEQKCANLCSEWSIVGYGTDEFWDLWIRSIEWAHSGMVV